jgi:four helix bundle protein
METKGYRGFEQLEVWKKTRELKNEILEEVKSFPPEEKYRLTDQLIRSTRSVNGQIAEGHGRKTYPDRLRFCVQARGSLSETLNHLTDAFDCKYISAEKLDYYRNKISEIEKLLNGYISWLEEKSKTR